MTGPVVKYGPSRSRPPMLIVVFVLVIGGLIWLAIYSFVTSDDGDIGYVAGVLVLAALLAAAAFAYLRRGMEWQARMEISPEGVTLEQWKGEEVPPTRAAWAEIAALRRWRTRRTVFYGIELRPEREGGRAKVVAVAGAGLELQSLNPMAAMEQFARDAGYDVEHVETSRGRRGRDRWPLVPRDGTGPSDG